MKIAITGKMCSGKTTLSNYLCQLEPKFQIFSFGKKVKEVAITLFNMNPSVKDRSLLTSVGQKMREINAQPKIFHKSMLSLFANIPTQWTTLDTYVFYICLLNGIKIIEMDVIFKTRIYGQSKWNNNFGNFIGK